MKPEIYLIDSWDFIKWKDGLDKVKMIVEEGKDDDDEKLGFMKTIEMMKKQLYKMTYYFLQITNFYVIKF